MAVMAIGDKASWAHRKNLFVPLALVAWIVITATLWLSRKSDSLRHFFRICAFSVWRSLLCLHTAGVSQPRGDR
jgi:hypothetical protein